MKTIGIAIICKNEEALLGRCLESVKEADNIYICDTGSTDDTVEIAKKYTPNVCTEFKWNDSFCDARNHVKSHVKEDWILSIDADEYCHDFSKVREAVELAKDCVAVFLHGEGGKADFRVPRLFRNTPDIKWFGAVHNHLGVTPEGEAKGMNVSGEGEKVGDVHITFGFSPAHEKDPDRSLRILFKEVHDPTKIRERYYLGRELWYKERYSEAIYWFSKHVTSTNFTAEKADSFLTMARCFSRMGLDDEAREACSQAIILNPQFKEAVRFMGDISPDQHRNQWYKFAELCDNSNLLFKRTD